MDKTLQVIRYDDAQPIAFGPLSEYRPLINDECPQIEVRTGIQTARPGYETRPHWHPYTEILHILEGEAQAWERGREDAKATLRAGDTLVIPPRTWHVFRATGVATLRLLGTHLSNQRVVHYDDGTTSLGGAPATQLVNEPRSSPHRS